MRKLVACYRLDETGASAVEYGLVASLISVTIIAGLTAIGVNLVDKGMEIADAILSSG